ncbi:MAG: YfcE family phosphodiesterase [Olegusella sp.]|jgi:putative phosphoesterase|nr:YfcE family phosphodiesterase [Olegusella sp.]
MRYDIVSDTHGALSSELIEALQGADVIVHAGDIGSAETYTQLAAIAPVHACLGNNDWASLYGPSVKRKIAFFSEGFRWMVCHYERDLDLKRCDIAICGHTHRPFVRRDHHTNTLVMNPGSPTWPRSGEPSMGRIIVKNETIVEARVFDLGSALL